MKKKIVSILLLIALIIVSVAPFAVNAAVAPKLSKSKAVMEVDSKLTLKLGDIAATDVKWSTSKKKVATVTSKGVITAKKEGIAKITATYNKKKYTCNVTVVDSNKKEEVIDGFSKAVYENYDSSKESEENPIYIEGTIKKSYVEYDLVCFVIEQDDGNEWVSFAGIYPYMSHDKAKKLVGTNVRLFGYYYGYKDGMPILLTGLIFNIDKNEVVEDTQLQSGQEELEEYEKEYKKKCKSYTYKEIARNPDKVYGEYSKVTGKVVQVFETDDNVELRVDITESEYGYYSDTVYVYYVRRNKGEDRILEDDIIEIYGTLEGLETYTSVLGNDVTLPKIEAEYIEILE